MASERSRFDDFSERLRQFEGLDDEVERQRAIERDHRPAYECYLQNLSEAEALELRERDVSETAALLEASKIEERDVRQHLEETAARYRAEEHAALKSTCEELGKAMVGEGTRKEGFEADLARAEKELSHLRRQEEKLREKRGELSELQRTAQALAFIRDTIKAAGPAVTETLLRNISQIANDIYAEIMDDHAVELRWDREYDVIVQRGAEERKFAQLSGGEQMSAALAVRLALLKEMSEVDFAFFDEPTQNMDADRRSNLADQISQVKGFEQLIVISHDDTFEHHTDNLIRLRKENEETRVEAS
jgi:exonuclease SbcC